MSQEFFVGGGAYNPSVRNRGNKKGLVALLVGASLLLVLILAVILIGGGSNKPSEKMIEYINKSDTKKSYSLFSDKITSTVSLDAWSKNSEEIKKYTSGKKIELAYSQKINDEQTQFAYNVGEPGSIVRLNLVVNKKGKVDAISYNKTSL